ncbi:MAG TPA: exodeoxyribonuclease VII small subunit [Gammaproteobacteria bacterium]|nr:exodeoxyribonuclease VII small subunit [Gammaproteobacteria bacterium]
MQLEKSLKELEKLVDKMEQGDLSLEKSLDYFEKGVKLTRLCQLALQQAEQRVLILLQQADQEHLEEFDADV